MSDNIENATKNEPIYMFHDFYRKKNGIYMVVAKIIGSARGVFTMPVSTIVTSRKDLLSKFSLEDKINIIGLATTETPPKITLNKSSQSRYFPLLAMLFGCALITSNIASSKLMSVFGFTITGGTPPYLLTYVLGSIITENYGYKRTRQLIWGATACNLFAVLFITLAIKSPSSPFWTHQNEYAFILGSVPRVVAASIIAYMAGEFLNAYIIAKRKISDNGDKLWRRIFLSSIAAMTVDNFLFLSIAYLNVMPLSEMIHFSMNSYIIGLLFEWGSIPFIAYISKKIKKNDNVDVFDINTNFTPFSLDVDYDLIEEQINP